MRAYQQARLARDARYDGKFFVAVKTTKIYCRPICPAPSPKEENVCYFPSAITAEQQGFRPCLRCRPESAPNSAAWLGNQALLKKAMDKIQNGQLNHMNLPEFSATMGISDRYLRQLFQKHLGISPNQYASHVKVMFAKQLLHQTTLSITDIAYSSGFKSLRRFNDTFKHHIKLTPSDVRAKKVSETTKSNSAITLTLYYAPPYNWPLMHDFLALREIAEFETVTPHSYCRTFQLDGCTGLFTAQHLENSHAFEVTIELSDFNALMPVIAKIRNLFDLNTDLQTVEHDLTQDKRLASIMQSGLRLPACWDHFEAGVKAILGQQVSVKAAYTNTAKLVKALGEKYNDDYYLFPHAQKVAQSELDFLKMPAARKQSIRDFANWCHTRPNANLEEILDIKGIGPWTFEYIKFRSGEDSDAFPEKDLGIIKAMQALNITNHEPWKPWRSYATLHLWNSL